MPEKQTDSERNTGLLCLAIDFMKWVDNTKKMIITITLVIFGIASYSLWENRTDITKFLMKQFAVVEINQDAIAGEAVSLMTELDAVLINIWSADPARNRKQLMYRRTPDGEDKRETGKSDVLFRANSSLIDPTVALLNSRSVCQTVEKGDVMYSSSGTNYMCAVSVPPAYADGFVGVIVLGFRKHPVHEDYVLQRMAQASQAIIN